MKQNIFQILSLFSFAIYAQVQEIPTDILKYDPNLTPQEIISNYYPDSNLDNDFRTNRHFFDMINFDLEKNKPVKSVSFTLSDDKSPAYHYEFDKEGKITFINDFVGACTHSYSYSKNLITIIEYSKHYNKNIKIDSVYFDNNQNVIKQSHTSYMDRNSEICVQSFLINKYSEDNKLIKKYFYGNHKKDKQTIGYICLYENFKDSIIKRQHYLLNENSSYQDFLNNPKYISPKYNKTAYYVNNKGKIYKIEYTSNDDNHKLRNYKTIIYDKLGRIIELNESESNYDQSFEYDNFGNLSQYKIGNDFTKYHYDDNRYISRSEEVYGTIQKTIDLSFINDEYGNWIKMLNKLDGSRPVLARRTIIYY
ncbi:hypothetical protein [Flavobacterium limi]|uniref:YD repeat-containing protein n=1 Tax=Flavobacterium limi TaxID=2045105 RepID=A0ABQ1U556_9FLAO|nr:hypothetical protein [Flavobacterium limi]GGF10275.1 hypothetical protein GCM10011518_19370 [Flavobacterium limi]